MHLKVWSRIKNLCKYVGNILNHCRGIKWTFEVENIHSNAILLNIDIVCTLVPVQDQIHVFNPSSVTISFTFHANWQISSTVSFVFEFLFNYFEHRWRETALWCVRFTICNQANQIMNHTDRWERFCQWDLKKITALITSSFALWLDSDCGRSYLRKVKLSSVYYLNYMQHLVLRANTWHKVEFFS